MRRRDAVAAVVSAPLLPVADARADASRADLASYYGRHVAVAGGVAWGWAGSGRPRRMRERVLQVGVSQDAFFALHDDGALVTWSDAPGPATVLMRGVARFAAGQSGWFAIDTAGVLWHAATGAAPQRIAADVVDACIGDSADYFVTRDGALYVKGLAHRGQYGDGKLAATPDFVATARDAVAVRAHTGHAIHLRRDGVVMGTGGNRFGPLSTHGLGDKADRWGPVFDGATAVATGSRHSAAIRADAGLWVWGAGFDVKPARLMDGVVAVACGDTATIARSADGRLWQWEGAGAPRQVVLA